MSADSTHNANSSSTSKGATLDKDESKGEYSYLLYPERKEMDTHKPSMSDILFEVDKTQARSKNLCEMKVWDAIKKSSAVKLMISAIQGSGCNFDARRNVTCEICDPLVNAGYDSATNQVLICQNMNNSTSEINRAMTHELIHMFDHCRAKLDFGNLEHLACTEIRAATLTHCSFFTALRYGNVTSPSTVGNSHQKCVKNIAVKSVMAVNEIPLETAQETVDKVFEKCYYDREPFGRIIRRNSNDYQKAYKERFLYGYS